MNYNESEKSEGKKKYIVRSASADVWCEKVKKWKGELNDADHVRNGKQVEYKVM